MSPGLGESIRAAFSARPIGMFVPPNWVGLAVFAGLGLLNPGFWIVGAGLELGYLFLLATNKRFQRTVAGKKLLDQRKSWDRRMQGLVAQLETADRERYRTLELRCRKVLERQSRGGRNISGLALQGQGLGRLMWVYLSLLLTRQSIEKVVHESYAAEGAGPRLEDRLAEVEKRLADEGLREDLRKSLTGQVEILRQRVEKRHEANQKLEFLDAELTRIQEQVELIREQAALSTDPEIVSERIDHITATLGGTSQWIQEQHRIYGTVEDILAEPPPMVAEAAKESA